MIRKEGRPKGAEVEGRGEDIFSPQHSPGQDGCRSGQVHHQLGTSLCHWLAARGLTPGKGTKELQSEYALT